MRTRCNNPKGGSWERYGGKGIRVCPRWDSFENFYADMGPRPSPDMSLDRWATELEQQRNRSFVKCNVEMAAAIRAAPDQSLKQLAERYGLSLSNISRIRSGAVWPTTALKP